MSVDISFEDLPVGSRLSNQYQALGITFNSGVIVEDSFRPGHAVSATYVDGGEFPYYTITGTFTSPTHSRISILAGKSGTAAIGWVNLTIFDSRGISLGSTSASINQFSHYVTIEAVSTSNIASFQVKGSRMIDFDRIDSLSFDNTNVVQQPDFHLQFAGDVVRIPVAASGSSVAIQIIRLYGSRGRIRFEATNLPPDIVVDILPDGATGTSTSFNFRVSKRSGTLTPFQNRVFTLTGTPESRLVGPTSHVVSIPLTVMDRFDVAVVGIEVTQSVQQYNLPAQPDPLSRVPVSYKSSEYLNLAEGGGTFARVFSTIRVPPLNSTLPAFECQLHGFRNGVELPYSPIAPVHGTSIVAGGDTVTDTMRANKNIGSLFAIPYSWAQGTITLRANLRNINFNPDLNHSTETNTANNEFTLLDVPFAPTKGLYIAPFRLLINTIGGGRTNSVDDPENVFLEARNVNPEGDGRFHIWPYQRSINISDYHGLTERWVSEWITGVGGHLEEVRHTVPVTSDWRGAQIVARLWDICDDLDYGGHWQHAFGIYPGQAGPDIRGRTRHRDDLTVAIVQDKQRPFSSVAHELGHVLGRKHASSANGAADADSWPPDQRGFLQSVGFNRRTHEVLFPDRTGGTLGGPFFDYMAYTGRVDDLVNKNQWISARGWKQILSSIRPVAPIAEPTTMEKSPEVINLDDDEIPWVQPTTNRVDGTIDGVVIHATIDPYGPVITKASPTCGRTPFYSQEATGWSFVILDEASKIHHAVSPQVVISEEEAQSPVHFLSALIPITDWSAVHAIEIRTALKPDTPILRQEKPKSAPSIKSMNIKPPSDNSEDFLVSWMTYHDALGHNTLLAKIDYSWDNGKTFTTVHSSPVTLGQSEVVVPATYFQTASEALVRVRVSDGFNVSFESSRIFESAGSPPQVTILKPLDNAPIKKGDVLMMHGSGFEDSGKPLAKDQLNWYVGKKVVAQGRIGEWVVDQQETFKLSLEGVDSSGRSTWKTVDVEVAF